jgi:hypothetical protein
LLLPGTTIKGAIMQKKELQHIVVVQGRRRKGRRKRKKRGKKGGRNSKTF